MSAPDDLQNRAHALRLYGLIAHWPDVVAEPWVAPLLQWEEDERGRRSLERRIRDAHLGSFKPLCDFDWAWPKRCDRAVVEELMALEFVKDTANVVLIGPNGVGKSTLALNLAYQAIVHGHTALFTTAGQMLGELAALDSDSALRRRLNRYASPDVLVVDLCAVPRYVESTASAFVRLGFKAVELHITETSYRDSSVHLNGRFTCWNCSFPAIGRAMLPVRKDR
ncbi:IstB-like ATP binding protein [Burkholderia sp. D7]|nr:IstB-like ATP binding protein [Burkholderia sp. D7]